MKAQIKARIQALKEKLTLLEQQWDKLDSTGRAEDQEELTRQMGEVGIELQELEIFLKQYPS